MLLIKKISVLLSILLICFCIYYSKNLKIDASSDTLIQQNDETYEYFLYYNDIFPTKNFLVLAIKSDNLIDKEYIENINIIKKEIKKINNIKSIFSIVDAPILLLDKLNLSNLNDKDITNINNTDKDLQLVLNEFATSPIFKDQIINSKKNVSSLIIYIKKNNEYEEIKNKKKNLINELNLKEINAKYKLEKEKNNLRKENTIKEIRKIIDKKNDNYQYFLGGIDMITIDAINFIKNDIFIFSIAVVIFIIIVLLIIYRSLKWVLIPLISSLYSLILMTGLIGFFNWEITAISSNFISLMLILSISMNIHIINNYFYNYLDSKITNNLKSTIQKMFWPCLYTTLTTMVAFASLLFSNIKPIIDFGNIMIVSLAIIFLTSFIILPLLLSYFPKVNKVKILKFSILDKFYKISIKYSNKIIIINIIVFTISIFGIYKLNVENSFINYFKSNTEIHKGMKLIDIELGGTTPLDILIKFKKEEITDIKINESSLDTVEDFDENFEFEDDLFVNIDENPTWFSEEKINAIKKIHEYLESRSEIGKVQSIYSLVQMANLINKKELSVFELSVLYNEIPDKYKEDLIDPYLSVNENMVKISTRIKDSKKIKRNELILDIENYLKKEFQIIEEYKVNGLLVLYNNMLSSLFTSQIKSFGIILISIFLMFIILFKSLKLSIIGIIPNIIASSFILGLIGLLGIPLDIMTITIAAITIGIAVDNTIHYIYRVKAEKINSKVTEKIIEMTNQNVGKAVLTTSLTISFGFSVLSMSNFIPTILFGVFTALAMIIAMIGVLITLPSIMIRFKI